RGAVSVVRYARAPASRAARMSSWRSSCPTKIISISGCVRRRPLAVSIPSIRPFKCMSSSAICGLKFFASSSASRPLRASRTRQFDSTSSSAEIPRRTRSLPCATTIRSSTTMSPPRCAMDNTQELWFGFQELGYDDRCRRRCSMRNRFKKSEQTQAPESGVHVGFLGQRAEGIRHTVQYLTEGTARHEHCFLIGPNSFVDAVVESVPEIALDRRIELVRTDSENLSPLALLGRIMGFVDGHKNRPRVRLVGCPEWLPPTQMLAWESLLTLI